MHRFYISDKDYIRFECYSPREGSGLHRDVTRRLVKELEDVTVPKRGADASGEDNPN